MAAPDPGLSVRGASLGPGSTARAHRAPSTGAPLFAAAADQGGIVADDLAYVAPWGCDRRQISTPVLFVHGSQDRLVPSSHATWLAQRCRTAELWLRPDDGHVSILNSSVMALDWLREHAR